jgi:GDP-mannose 6-dehydrogenase
MNVSIFGLGYVGVVTSACLARDGNNVIGVDVNKEKVAMVLKGKAPIVELGLAELLSEVIAAKRLSATTSVADAVAATEVSLVCVGSPSAPDGSTYLGHVFDVCQQLGAAIAKKREPHTVIIRSTVPPGTTEKCREIIKERIGKGTFHIGFNPEFLREGSAINDFHSAPFTIIGTDDPIAENAVRELYSLVQSPVLVMEYKVAEMIKFTCNAWHAAKISFSNEIGRIAKSVGVDGRKVMEVIIQDLKLNVSPAYMRPGFAFGGSCLPKDVRSLIHIAQVNNVQVPLLTSMLDSNDQHINRSVQLIMETGKRNVSLLGLAFKSGTDDLRESPAVELAERLLGKGFNLKIYDPAVHEAKLMGANKLYIESKLPHLTRLLTNNIQEIVDHGEVLIVTHAAGEFRSLIDTLGATKIIIDLAGLLKPDVKEANYAGVSW